MPRHDVCPICGGPKRSVSARCNNCRRQSQNENLEYHINWKLATPVWLSEFRGLFWGEGYAGIVRNNTSFSPVLALRLRDDDGDLIRDIQSKLGGRYLISQTSLKNPNAGDSLEWRTTDLDHCIELCHMLLDSVLPAKKYRDTEAVLDFCTWRKTVPYFWTDKDRAIAEGKMLTLMASREYRKC